MAALAWCAAGAAAQDLRPPVPDNVAGPSFIVPILGALALAAAVLFSAAMPSKRGHQD